MKGLIRIFSLLIVACCLVVVGANDLYSQEEVPGLDVDCNGIDDDQDGQIDEDAYCTENRICVDGQCVPRVPDGCDGQDNDGDGMTDEDAECPEGQECIDGACQAPQLGVDADGDGSFTPEDCDDNDPDVFPGNTPDICDGKDNDCDYIGDEDAACPEGQWCRNGSCVPEGKGCLYIDELTEEQRNEWFPERIEWQPGVVSYCRGHVCYEEGSSLCIICTVHRAERSELTRPVEEVFGGIPATNCHRGIGYPEEVLNRYNNVDEIWAQGEDGQNIRNEIAGDLAEQARKRADLYCTHKYGCEQGVSEAECEPRVLAGKDLHLCGTNGHCLPADLVACDTHRDCQRLAKVYGYTNVKFETGDCVEGICKCLGEGCHYCTPDIVTAEDRAAEVPPPADQGDGADQGAGGCSLIR